MIFHIEISSKADTDLRNIYEYIAFELQSPDNAIGQLNRLEVSIMGLEQMPERFHKYENEPWRSRGLWIMTVKMTIQEAQNKTVSPEFLAVKQAMVKCFQGITGYSNVDVLFNLDSHNIDIHYEDHVGTHLPFQ